MSKESALNLVASQPAEIRPSLVTGPTPENAKAAANPAVENKGALPDSPHSAQLAHLMKKEAKFQQDREAFKKEQEEFRAIKAKVEDVYKKTEAFEATRKVDPIKAMRDLGFSEKEIIDYLSQDEVQIPPEERAQKAVQAEIEKFKQEQLKEQKEAQTKKDQDIIQTFRGQLKTLLQSNTDKYEIASYYGPQAEELMFNIAVEEAKEGRTIDIHSIAEDVEDYYMKEYESLKKLKKLTPQQEVQVETKKVDRTRTITPPEDIVKPKVSTLTNKIMATSASLARPSGAETREQKRERLEQMIRNGWTR